MTVKEQVIQAKNNGYTYKQISDNWGIAKSTASDWYAAWVKQQPTHPIAFTKPVQPPKQKTSDVDVFEFLSGLAPIKLGNLKTEAEMTHNPYIVVLSDLHFPNHCQKSIEVVLHTIDALKPQQIILNGDTMDMLAVSRFPKDIRTRYDLLKERTQYQQFLKDLIEVSGGAKITETHSNHSGDGQDGRWFRYLSERLGELACLPDIAEKLSYENVFIGELQEYVEHCDFVEVCPDLIVMHGDVVRKHGGYSARGMLEKYYQSIIMGHTHRLGMTAQRLPALGSRKEKQVYAYEMGCMCDLNPVYATGVNWQNGFGIIAVGNDTFGVEPVLIQDGVATVTTLGYTISVN